MEVWLVQQVWLVPRDKEERAAEVVKQAKAVSVL